MGRRLWSVGLPTHVLVYCGLLTCLLFLFPASGSFSSDDGAYAGAVHALENGSWTLDRPLPEVESFHEGWINSRLSDEGPLPYVRHPGYVYVLYGSTKIFGSAFGIGVPAVIGSIMAAVAAWLIAAIYDRASTRSAFWIVALSPMVFNATTFWAHSLATGFCGLALWATIRATRATGNAVLVSSLLVVASSTTAAVFLRTEVVLWLVALAVGVGVATRSVRVSGAVWAALGPGFVAFLADRWWSQTILDQYNTSNGVGPPQPSWLSSRLSAGFHTFLSPSNGATGFCILLAVALIVFGSTRYRLRGDTRAATGLFVIAGLLFVVPLALDARPLTGLVAAWPVVFAAAIAGRKKHDDLRLLYLPAIGLAVLVFLTQYATGGGLEWGGRYMSISLVGLGVWAALRLRQLSANAPLGLIAIVIGPAILALGVSYNYHVRSAAFVAVPMVNNPDVVVSKQPAGPRTAWSALPTAWYTADEENLQSLLDDLGEAEVARISVYDFDEVMAPVGYKTEVLNDRVTQLVAE